MDPDPRIWIRVRVTPNSFRKILNMSFLKENSDPRLPLGGSVYVSHFSFKKDPVPGLRIETRPPSHLYRSKVWYCTATDYGPGICIQVRIPHWRIKIKLLGVRIRVQCSDPDLLGLVRIIRASHSNDVRCPRWRGQSQEDDYQTEVRFNNKNLLKNQSFCLLRFT